MYAKIMLFVFMSKISPSLTTIEANFPSSIVPNSLSTPNIFAALLVIDANAC